MFSETSSSSAAAANSRSSRRRLISSGKPRSSRSAGPRLTATVTSKPSRRSSPISSSARSTTNLVSTRVSPLCSASGRNWAGASSPSDGCAQRSAQTQRGGARARLIARLECHRELVAAKPCEQIILTQQRAQARADLPQNLIAGVVTKRVIELLEPIKIDQQQRQPHAAALRL